MTIASEIQRIKTNISNAYDILENKGATMPLTENSNNLANTVATIPSGGGNIIATNYTGNQISDGELVFIENPSVDRDDNIGTGYAYSSENHGILYMCTNGSKVARNGQNSNTCQIYDVILGLVPVANGTFQKTYQGAPWRFFEGDSLYQLDTTNLTNNYLKFSTNGAEIVSGTGKYYIGAGLYSDGVNAYDGNGNLVYTITGGDTKTRMNNAYQVDSSHLVIVYTQDYSYPNNIAKVDIVNGTGTQSEYIDIISGTGTYSTRLGFTSDGKYYICSPNRIINVASWVKISQPSAFSLWNNTGVSYFNNIGNIMTFKCSDGYIRSYKYNPDDETWSEVTSIAVQTNGVVGVSNSAGTILLYMSSSGSAGNASINVKQYSAEDVGWYILPFSRVTQNALSGVAKENISTGTEGEIATIIPSSNGG